MMMARTSFLVVLLFSVCFSLAVYAADLDENQAQLRQVKARIEKAEQSLKDKKQVEIDLTRELALLKRNLQRIDQRLSSLKNEQSNLRSKIRQQQTAISKTKAAVGKSRKLLEKRLVALYKEGDVGPLKILFSAESPTEMVQQYNYLTRVLQRDVDLLDNYRAALTEERSELEKLESLESAQKRVVADEQKQHDIAAEARRLQSRLLNKAALDKKSLAQQLETLRKREKDLTQLINRLTTQSGNNRAEDIHSAPDTGPVATDFAVGRGKLGWPVQGRVIIAFGRQRDAKLGTYYESNGIEIAAKQGRPIKAVAGGKVVFADYFKGYGNLVILSHPGGYHTLYAHTDKMQRRTGDSVSAGDLLGYCGLGGRDSIYFEIRKKGSPVNPLSWLKRR